MKKWHIVAISWCFASFLSAQQVEDKVVDKKEKVAEKLSPIEGQWRGVKGFEGTEKMPIDEISSICMEYHAQHVVFAVDGDVAVGLCRYDAKKNRMLLMVKDGDDMITIPVIYKLEKDKLTVCHYEDFEDDLEKYPDSMEPAEGLFVVELKRVASEKRLEGKWESIEIIDENKKLDETLTLIFEKGIMTVKEANDNDEDVVRFLTDTSAEPKRLLTADDGNLSYCIYKIEKGILTICLSDTEYKYPKNFEPGEGVVVFKLKRVAEEKVEK